MRGSLLKMRYRMARTKRAPCFSSSQRTLGSILTLLLLEQTRATRHNAKTRSGEPELPLSLRVVRTAIAGRIRKASQNGCQRSLE